MVKSRSALIVVDSEGAALSVEMLLSSDGYEVETVPMAHQEWR